MLRFSCLFLILFHVAKLTHGDRGNMEIEAIVRMDPIIMKKFQESMMASDSLFKKRKSSDNDIIPRIQARASENFIEELMPQKLKPENKAPVEKYEQRMFSKGIDNLKAVGEYLQKKFAMNDSDVAPLVKELSLQYISKLQSYFNFLLRKKTYSAIDRDYVVLDMVSVANSLESSVDRTLLNHLLDKRRTAADEDKQVAGETIAYFNLNEKRNEMKYICKQMGICRIYPGFTEYFAKLLSEVLKLFDVKFHYLITKSVHNLNSNCNFFKKILSKEILEWFTKKTENVANAKITDVREVISVLRSAITHRYRMVNTNDHKLKTKTAASRILLDIIDKVYDQKGEDYILMQFETIIPAVSEWAGGVKNDMEDELQKFINLSISTLKFELNDVAADEIKTLAEIIYNGKPLDEDMAKCLMTKGSKFVQGKDLTARLKPDLKL